MEILELFEAVEMKKDLMYVRVGYYETEPIK